MDPRKFSQGHVWTSRSTTVSQVFTRAVILPATPLLVPGAAGEADPLRQVRLAACALLAVLAETGPPLVLAARSGAARGPVLPRPSLAAAGIADHMLPDDVVAPWEGHTDRPVAGTAASALLFCAGSALGERATDIPVLEVPATDSSATDAAPPVSAHLADGGTVVIGSGAAPGTGVTDPAVLGTLDPAISAVLAATGVAGWIQDTRVFVQRHDHLPTRYVLTELAPAAARHPIA